LASSIFIKIRLVLIGREF